MPKLPTELLKRANASYEGPFWEYPDKVVERRPTIKTYPGNFEDRFLDAGPLIELKKRTTITRLWLDAGPKTSDVASDSFVVDITPGAMDDIGTLTCLESLTVWNVDLTRAGGLNLLKSLDELQHLQFNNRRVELSDVLEHLPACKHLRSLRIFYVPLVESSDKPDRRRVVITKRRRVICADPREEECLEFTLPYVTSRHLSRGALSTDSRPWLQPFVVLRLTTTQ